MYIYCIEIRGYPSPFRCVKYDSLLSTIEWRSSCTQPLATIYREIGRVVDSSQRWSCWLTNWEPQFNYVTSPATNFASSFHIQHLFTIYSMLHIYSPWSSRLRHGLWIGNEEESWYMPHCRPSLQSILHFRQANTWMGLQLRYWPLSSPSLPPKLCSPREIPPS